MPDVYGPFDGAPWAEAQWYDYARAWSPSGLLGTVGGSTSTGDFAISTGSLTVSAGAGRAWVAGAGLERTAPAPTHTVTANTNATLSRRDRLVLRRSLASHNVVTAVITGTPAATPVAPALTQDPDGIWEVPLFSFLVPPASGTTISGIIDERIWLYPDVNPAVLDTRLTAAETKVTNLQSAAGSTDGTRTLPKFWGSGTVFPVSGVQTGDTYRRTDVGSGTTLMWTGSIWRQVDVAYCSLVSDRPPNANSALHVGFRIFIGSRNQTYEFDGTYWRNGLAGDYVPGGSVAGDVIHGLTGSNSTTTNSVGTVSTSVGVTFSSAIDYVVANAGSTGASGAVRSLVPNHGSHTASNINVTAYNGSGTGVNADTIRVNYHVIGRFT